MIALRVGETIGGRYELRRDLGCTARGLFFEATHRFTKRAVAVKVLPPDVRSGRGGELSARMMREARALSAIRHPGVVEVLDAAVLEDGTPYLVFEMLEGRTLEGLLATRGQLSPAVTAALAIQVCEALAVIHAAGVVHRNLKPGNIFVIPDAAGRDRVKLVDFGVAHVSDPREAKLTAAGAVLGTPWYIPPEQLLAENTVDSRVDLYALGVTMFECLAGRLPFEGTHKQVTLAVCGDGPRPRVIEFAPAVPPALAAVVDRALARARDDRFETATLLAKALEQALPSGPKPISILSPPQVLDATPLREGAPAVKTEAPKSRETVRAPYSTSVRIVMDDGVIDGRTEDISAGGLLVISRDPCEANQRGEVRFALPLEGEIVSCSVVLRWVSSERPGRRGAPRAIGLQFVDPPSKVTATIARYVAQLKA